MLSITEGPASKRAKEAVIVDALPYIDSEYDEPGMKEMVTEMIEEEKRRYRPIKNYLEHLPPLELHRFETEIMKNEYERIAQRIPMETLSMKRYELPPPPPGKLMDIAAWSECLDNSYAQLEHQATRIANLELMVDCGAEGWKSYLSVVNRMVKQSQTMHQNLKREIQELNWSRKSAQLKAGEELQRLQNSWVALVSKNFELELACQSKELIKYEKSAELAQLKFIVSDAQSDRSGSRIRRRVRRFFLQKPNEEEPVTESNVEDPPGTSEEQHDDDEGDEEMPQVDPESPDDEALPVDLANKESVPIQFETTGEEPMDSEQVQRSGDSDEADSDEDDDEDQRPPPSAGQDDTAQRLSPSAGQNDEDQRPPPSAGQDDDEEDEIGPQPYVPDAEKIQSDPDRSPTK